MDTIHTRIRALREQKGLSMEGLAKLVGVSWQTIQQWENGKMAPKRARLDAVAQSLGTTPESLLFGDAQSTAGEGPNARHTGRTLIPHDQTDEPVGEIALWDARGSCGGGSINHEVSPGLLVKEASFFRRFNLKPANAVAIYADGDSMADFIIDGDIVIFDRSRREPRSDRIFLLEHPDGLRIKQLHRETLGGWTLQSRNQDKAKYPDERISEADADSLKILGEFVYRQGGY